MPTTFARFARILTVALGITVCLHAALNAQETQITTNSDSSLASFTTMEGTWVAKGDGFASTLRYEWVFPDVLLRATNELKNDAGELIGQYEGHYVWDADQSKVVFWTVSKRGELHQGTATWSDGRLWHDARISGGRIKGYRSLITVNGNEMAYRAQYKADATDQDVEASEPLIYRKR